MPVDRPTFSESWYRVTALKPRLRSTVEIHRQHYRGRMWYVLQDPSNNQFYRQNEAAYHFVALLDGHRTIGDVWQACNEELGDSAPTQGEAIQLLGQLYTSNLIQCELPPDALGLFTRFQKRRQREVKGYLSNLLFIRIPIFDPDHFLDRWVKLFGQFFSPAGMVLWVVMVAAGLVSVINHFDLLMEGSNKVLDPENLPLLYLSFVFIKVIHEFGHGFACKKFGQQFGGGEVHTMGIMFLVFTPLPYVDASSAWAFPSKWHRVVVGAGGILIELFVAAIAAIVWANTQGGTIHTIAYNVMFIASVSTLLFNANPLLRYDGYYILSDLVEIPNLSQRAKQYLYYLVKRYIYGVRNPRNPAHTTGEKIWFVFYGLASTVYRVFICARILMFVAKKFFIVGFVLGVAAVVAWVFVPLGKFIHYLATSSELIRVRGRALASTAAFLAAIVMLVGVLQFPDRHRLEGVVEPVQMAGVYAETDGRIVAFLPNRTEVVAGEDVVIQLENMELQTQLEQMLADREAAFVERRQAQTEGKLVEADKLRKQIAYDDKEIVDIRKKIAGLTIRATVSGTWLAPRIEQLEGAYVQRTQRIGVVADLSEVIIRCTAGQNMALLLKEEAVDSGMLGAEIRLKRRPDDSLTGQATLADFVPAGQSQLFSPALAHAAGGSMATDPTDQRGMAALEKYVEIRFTPDGGGVITDDDGAPTGRLLPGQRVVVRVEMPKRPLMSKWWRGLRQLVQRRFRI